MALRSTRLTEINRTGEAATYGGLLADGIAREFIWGCELSKATPFASWQVQDASFGEDELDYLRHTLFLKQAVLGASAVKNEQNIVAVETLDFYKQAVKQPIVSLASGISHSCILDLNFSGDLPLKFTLISGTGPVFLTASHLIEYPDTGFDEYDSEGGNEAELCEAEEVDDAEETEKGKKTKPLQAVEQSEPKSAKKRKNHWREKETAAKKERLDAEAEHAGSSSSDADESDEDASDGGDRKYQIAKQSNGDDSSSDSSETDDEIEEKAPARSTKKNYADSDEEDSSEEGSSSPEYKAMPARNTKKNGTSKSAAGKAVARNAKTKKDKAKNSSNSKNAKKT